MRILIFMVMALLPSSVAFCDGTARPAAWAVPLVMAGVPNLHKVDVGVYRSAQPSAIGMKNLEAVGFKTVINLRAFHTDKDEVRGTGLRLEHIPMQAWSPEVKEVERFLTVVMDPAKRPVLFHCWHGADRTGTQAALYRVVVQGWTKEAAIDEMVNGGYGFHAVWTNLPPWIRDVDTASIKNKISLRFPAVAADKQKLKGVPSSGTGNNDSK